MATYKRTYRRKPRKSSDITLAALIILIGVIVLLAGSALALAH